MKTTAGLNLRSFLLAAALLAGLSCTSHGAVNQAVLIDLNSRTATRWAHWADLASPRWVGWAYSINDAGQVVGVSTDAEGISHPFITGLN
jgi:hypothetical protein